MTRGLAIVLTACLLDIPAAAGAQAPQSVDGIAAVVNNFVFTKSFVRAVRELRLVEGPAAASDAAATLAVVERHLVMEEVGRYGVPDPAGEAVAQRRREWTATLPAGVDVPAALQRLGLSEDDLVAWLREDVRIRVYLDKLFSAAAQPTAAEIARLVGEHEADLVAGGASRTPDALEAAARKQLAKERRQALIADWIDNLKRRADIAIKIK